MSQVTENIKILTQDKTLKIGDPAPRASVCQAFKGRATFFVFLPECWLPTDQKRKAQRRVESVEMVRKRDLTRFPLPCLPSPSRTQFLSTSQKRSAAKSCSSLFAVTVIPRAGQRRGSAELEHGDGRGRSSLHPSLSLCLLM